MAVQCLITIEGAGRLARNPYYFELLPRVGEQIKLPDHREYFEVVRVAHHARDQDDEKGVTVLDLRKL